VRKSLWVVAVLTLLLVLVASVPAVAAPTFDWSVLMALGDGTQLGGSIGWNAVEKPPDATVGGLWVDVGLIMKEPYVGLSTEAKTLDRLTAGIVKRLGGGYALDYGWQLVVLSSWTF